LKKCPRCNSISADSDSSCGVCGGSLSEVISESLEQIVQKDTRVQPKKKLKLGPLALGIFALASTVAGAALLFFNGIGIILLLVGLSAIIVMLGGAGGPMRRGGVGWKRMRGSTRGEELRGEEEARRYAEERKKQRGQED
jgi:hypothetical protein